MENVEATHGGTPLRLTPCFTVISSSVCGVVEPFDSGGSRESWLEFGILGDQDLADGVNDFVVPADGASVGVDAPSVVMMVGHDLPSLGAVANQSALLESVRDTLSL